MMKSMLPLIILPENVYNSNFVSLVCMIVYVTNKQEPWTLGTF